MDKSTKIWLLLGGVALTLGVIAFTFRKQAVKFLLDAHHEKHIMQLHPSVQSIFRRFIDGIEKNGWRVIVTSSYRSFADQQRLKTEGNAMAAQAGLSPHNYGFALDINLQKGMKLVKMDSSTKEWEETGAPAIARMLGIRWGGTFTGIQKGDNVHFDKLPMQTKDLRQIAIAQFGNDPDKILGNKLYLT